MELDQNNRAVFTGLTNEELASFNGGSNIGHRLICGCATRGITPLRWLDVNGEELPKNRGTRLVDYKTVKARVGSNVRLRINKDGFSCAQAGSYTCVVGNNTRSVLVTPIGECSG